ncbi:hypothetical protein VOLCADRAFT_108676, partial [Volvox carteri f. nagariensis]
MCGGVVEVKSVEQLQDELLKRGLAKSLYVHVMVPTAPHAGFLPALCTASDNTDGSVELLRKMMEVDEALHGAGGVAMGHCGDADKGTLAGKVLWCHGVCSLRWAPSNNVDCLRYIGDLQQDENGRLKCLMPHALTHSANALWETNNIVPSVYMLPGRDDPSGGQYIMHEDDKVSLRDYCETHKFVLDEKGAGWRGNRAVQAPIQASLAPGGLMSTPKPGQPRQRKLELRVDSAARGDVAAALGQQTKSGRKVQPTLPGGHLVRIE